MLFIRGGGEEEGGENVMKKLKCVYVWFELLVVEFGVLCVWVIITIFYFILIIC